MYNTRVYIILPQRVGQGVYKFRVCLQEKTGEAAHSVQYLAAYSGPPRPERIREEGSLCKLASVAILAENTFEFLVSICLFALSVQFARRGIEFYDPARDFASFSVGHNEL